MNSFRNLKDAKTLYQAQHLLVLHCPSYRAVLVKMSGYLEEPEARELFISTLDSIDQTGATFMIVDFREFKGCNLNLAKYASQVWIPQLAGKGITHAVINTPKSEFGAFTTKIALGQKAHSLIEIKHYEELEEGITWLKDMAG